MHLMSVNEFHIGPIPQNHIQLFLFKFKFLGLNSTENHPQCPIKFDIGF